MYYFSRCPSAICKQTLTDIVTEATDKALQGMRPNLREEPKNTDKTEPLVLQETDITDIPDENKGTEVQETA